jgi:hypothetical protein
MRAALAVAVTAVVATCSAEVYFEETFDVFDKDLWVHSTQWKVHDEPPRRCIVALPAIVHSTLCMAVQVSHAPKFIAHHCSLGELQLLVQRVWRCNSRVHHDHRI